MKKGIGKVLLAFFVIGLLSKTMCIQAAAQSGREGTAEAFLQYAGGKTDQYTAPHYGTGNEFRAKIAFARQISETTAFWQETAEALAVRTYGHNVRVTNYSDRDVLGYVYESIGSGVIFAIDDNFVYIVTAEHCLKRENTMVEFADGSRYVAMTAYRNPAKDVGFVLVNKAVMKEETLRAILPAAGADAQAVGKVGGDMLFAITSADAPNGRVYAGILDQYSVVYPNNPVQNVMQFFSDVSYGSSGGAVYTAEGIWVGCVSGGDTFGICWAVPYSDIMNEFALWMEELARQQTETAA